MKCVNNPFTAVVFSPFIAFKITAIHIKTTPEYSHYKRVQMSLLSELNVVGWGAIKTKQQKNTSVEERGHLPLFYPVKGVPMRDTHIQENLRLVVSELVRTVCTNEMTRLTEVL